MKQFNIRAAKTHLSALVEQAASGEPFIIAKAGLPLVMVSPYKAADPLPRIGFMEGQITVPDDFDRLFEEDIAALFDGTYENSEGTA